MTTSSHTEERKPAVLAAVALTKLYGAARALDDVNVEVRAGEALALVGENGAGKSTLLKTFAGAVRPSSGSVEVDGFGVRLNGPRQAIAAGIGMVTQELALVPARTVLENVFLGRWSHRHGLVATKRDRARYAALHAEFGFEIDPDARVAGLSLGAAQQVEIMKVLARGARIVILDEPSAVLSEREQTALHRLVRRLVDSGKSVVLATHFLDEAMQLCERIAVMRDGKHVATFSSADVTPVKLVKKMVGRELSAVYPSPRPIDEKARPSLAVEALSGGRVREVSFHARQGEIVGLAGLVGSGRSETLRLIVGVDHATSGQVRVGDAPIRRRSVRTMLRLGVALIPESRKDDGLVMVRPVIENISLPTLSRNATGGVVRRRLEQRLCNQIRDRLDIRMADPTAPVWTLSGGNQQKVLIGKWLGRAPDILLFDEPTRGVDIAAKAKIHNTIVELAAAGTTVVLASSEIEEVLTLAHRVIVLRNGRSVGEFARGATREAVMATAFGTA